jgi:predicted MFS family arabinose efflux permease
MWIAFAFQETFVKKSDKAISLSRFLGVFAEAYQNKRIRHLGLVFLLMQIGVALYLPIILVLLTTEFGYSPLSLGLFNGYLGAGFAFGLLFVLPKMLKALKIEQIVYIALFTTLISQFFSSLFHWQVILWLLAFPFAAAVEIAFSGMFTSFSNATDEKSQGWVMGISVAIMAIAWAIGGFSALLIPVFGGHLLIFIGSICLGMSAILMKNYSSKHL